MRRDRLISFGFFIVIVIFFALFLKDVDYSSLATISVSWPMVGLASVLGLGFRYWGVLVWRIILRDLGSHDLPSFATLSKVYAKAWLARYVPGTVAWIASKVYMANKHGISKSRLAVSSLLEGAMQVVAISTVSILILSFDSRLEVISTPIRLLLLLVGLSLFVLISPPIFNRLANKAYKLLRKEEASSELQINKRAAGRSFMLYTIGAFITGTSYFLLTVAINPDIRMEHYFFIVGTFNLAGAMGMATPFLPSGLGIRDGVQLVLLSIIMPKETAIIVTVASRLWSALIDIVFYVSAKIYEQLKSSSAS